MVQTTRTTCEHPIEQIRVVMHIVKQLSSADSKTYRVEKATAHCISCNSNLPETEKNARIAIDVAYSAKEHDGRPTIGRNGRSLRTRTTS